MMSNFFNKKSKDSATSTYRFVFYSQSIVVLILNRLKQYKPLLVVIIKMHIIANCDSFL